jgi:hydrogenase nickel incorporation protein HypA/HybF
MHEGSIAKSIIDSSLSIIEKEGLKKAITIKIMVGKIHAIVPQLLFELYDIMKEDYPKLSESQLEIEELDVKIFCNHCQQETLLDEPFFICPKCGSPDVKMLQGKELHIVSIEGEK